MTIANPNCELSFPHKEPDVCEGVLDGEHTTQRSVAQLYVDLLARPCRSCPCLQDAIKARLPIEPTPVQTS